MRGWLNKLCCLSLIISGPAAAAPGNFSSVIGSALVCNDQVNSAYFNGYMKQFFGAPAFTAGGANWWKVNDSLFNAPVEYVFVGTGHDFIGATFRTRPAELVVNIRDAMGIEYKQIRAETWVSPAAGALITYHDKNTPSKMYCIGSPHTAY
ncbi:MAG TPA: hypothetical protein VFW59_12240 [Gallionella sp.]|nr:hypothetical protein [Gallionella sp.]